MNMVQTTHASTETLKGLAIVTVLINHYLNMNVSGNCTGFANLIIGVFFILSGYGIYYSLDRMFSAGAFCKEAVIEYYFTRAIRIFPLFWVAYILETILSGNNISILTLIGLRGPGHYWFIPAILQCYLVAPFVYLLVKKGRMLAINVLVFAFVLLNFTLNSNFIYQHLGYYFKYVHLGWRNCFFLYVLLFSLSMLLPTYPNPLNKMSNSEKMLLFYYSISFVLIFMISSKYRVGLEYLFDFFVKSFVPLVLIAMSSIYFLYNRLEIRVFSWIGRISFSVFLFHMIFYKFVDSVFGFGFNSISELLIILVLYPFFFFGCKYVESFVSIISGSMKRNVVSYFSRIRNIQ